MSAPYTECDVDAMVADRTIAERVAVARYGQYPKRWVLGFEVASTVDLVELMKGPAHYHLPPDTKIFPAARRDTPQ